jgi:hypothetical protein
MKSKQGSAYPLFSGGIGRYVRYQSLLQKTIFVLSVSHLDKLKM